MKNNKKGYAVTYRINSNKVAIQSRHTHESNCILDETRTGFTLTHITNQSKPFNVLGIFENRYDAKRKREWAVKFFEGLGYEITTQKELLS